MAPRSEIDDHIAQQIDQIVRARRLLLISDFDGTLAEVSPLLTPPLRLVRGARPALRRLANIGLRRRRSLTTVILSGRRASDLARTIRVPGLWYVGNHGIEWLGPNPDESRSPVARSGISSRAVEIAQTVLTRLDMPNGIALEEKGSVAAIHWRGSTRPERDGALVLQTLGAVLDERIGRSHVPLVSRMAVEIRPARAPQKRDTVAKLVRIFQPTAVVIIGDDEADALAHFAARDLETKGVVERTFCVGVRSDSETPDALLRSSDAMVPGPAAVPPLLSRFAERLTVTTDRRLPPSD